MISRYTIVEFEEGEVRIVIHKVGCANIKQDVADGGSKEMAKLDLEQSDPELLNALDPGGEVVDGMEEVELCECTGYVQAEDDEALPAKETPAPIPPAARASQEAARARLLKAVEDTVEALIAKRGQDDIGLEDKWGKERLMSCTDDYVYDLAVEVRKLRSKGEPWWRVAYELGLPGSGATNKQGRKGSAFARRLWRAAWGKTYVGDGTVTIRESKANREARALANEGKSFFSEADEPMDIEKAICGQMIHWVTRLPVPDGIVTSAQEAYVHDDPKLVRCKFNPNTKKHYVEFYEQLDPAMLAIDPRRSITKAGPLRAVYVDRITRVGV